MKNIITAITTLVLGLILGYFFFGRTISEDKQNPAKHQHSETEEVWTCSMHPEIRLPEFGPCPKCGMDLIKADASSSNENPLVFEMSADAVKIANIQTSIVGKTSGENEAQGLKLSGKISANETTTASIVSHIPGRIEQLFVSFTGEQIKKGQKIATIYSANLITAQKELIEAYKVKAVNPKLFEATKNKLKYWKITDAQIENIFEEGEVIEVFSIYADYSGVVQEKKVSVGDHLMEGGVLFKIQNLNKLWVLFDVYENQLSAVNIGDEMIFTTTSLANKTFTAKVSFIDPIINPKTRTASVRLLVNNKDKLLKPEMFVAGMLLIKDSDKTQTEDVLVPNSAVLWTGQRSVVYVKVPDTDLPSYEFREVLLGNSVGTYYIIKEGIKNGEEIVTNGAFVIDASAQLNNNTSMMNRSLLEDEVEDSEVKERLPDYASELTIDGKDQIQKVLTQYLKLKDALVATDFELTIIETNKLKEINADLKLSISNSDAEDFWNTHFKIITDEVANISKANNVKLQRKSFDKLSNSLIKITKVFSIANQPIYVQFCPMAGKEGAFWLSTESNIMNPYFGDQMLTCGEVKEVLE